MSKETNQLRWGSILSYGQMALGVIIGLLYTPVMIRILGKSEFGLYNTVSSTIAMLTLLSLGFNSSYIRYYSKYKKNDDVESIYKLNGLFLIIFTVIGLVALLCGLYLSFNLELVFEDGLTASEYKIARVLMLLLTLSLTLSFPGNVFSSIIAAHERFVFLKLWGMVQTVLGPLVTLPLLLMGYRSIAMVMVSVIVSIITYTAYVYYTFSVIKQKFIFKGFEKGIFISLFSYTGFIALNMFVDQVNSNIDNLLLTRYKGTAAVAVYAVGQSLYAYYQRLSTSVSNVFTPRIHKLINNFKDNSTALRDEFTSIFIKVGRVQFLIILLVATGFIFFGRAFIVDYWAGAGYDDAYYVALLLMLPSIIPLTQNLGIEIQRAQNLHKFRSLFYTGMALINLTLSIYLCQLYGPIGSAAGTAFATLISTGIAMNIYYHKKCHIDIKKYWKTMLRMCVGLIPPIVFGIILCSVIDQSELWQFIIGMLAYTAVYCASMWFLSMNSFEKSLIINARKKVFGR